ncbi:hypothetical protein BJY01DRAFT_253566 [Aspergillus pseudoustus]|uniref:Uncharacterized protein n=1 Tax=Aspergillus pseudoustus TaxID=1810923 RepID=A0ABR4J0Z6_9EURO
MHFAIASIAAIASLVASSSAIRFNPVGQTPWNLHLDNYITWEPAGEEKTGWYVYLTNYHGLPPPNPCISLGPREHNYVDTSAGRFDIQGEIVREHVVPHRNYSVRFTERPVINHDCSTGGDIRHTDDFEVLEYYPRV